MHSVGGIRALHRMEKNLSWLYPVLHWSWKECDVWAQDVGARVEGERREERGREKRFRPGHPSTTTLLFPRACSQQFLAESCRGSFPMRGQLGPQPNRQPGKRPIRFLRHRWTVQTLIAHCLIEHRSMTSAVRCGHPFPSMTNLGSEPIVGGAVCRWIC